MAAPAEEPLTPEWQSVGGFFRVFDVAFFLPGALVLLGALLFRGAWVKTVTHAVLEGVALTEDPGLLAALGLGGTFIVLAFVAGLVCHVVARVGRASVARLGAWHWRRSDGKGAPWRWYRHPYWSAVRALFALEGAHLDGWAAGIYGPLPEKRAPADSQLLLYFWNMATLCWNVAAAFVLVAVFGVLPTHRAGWSLLPLGLALLLSMLGSEFRYFWEKERRKTPESLGGSV